MGIREHTGRLGGRGREGVTATLRPEYFSISVSEFAENISFHKNLIVGTGRAVVHVTILN